MKATDFVNLLRKVIREEVRTVVKEELKKNNSVLKEVTASQRPRPSAQPAPAPPKRTQPIVTFDGPLGDLLNETAQGMYSAPQDEEWPDMMQTMTSDMVPGAGLSQMLGDEDLPADTGMYGSDPTLGFVKNYSAVMKAADQYSNK